MSLHHRFDGGDRAPVLVLAGSLGTTLELWDELVDPLSGRYRLLRYDHPGHGRSPAGPRTVEGFARAVLDLLDEQGLERVSFCGLSLGSAVGMWLGANAPERIDRLVLACMPPQVPPPSMWEERAALVRAEGTEVVADGAVGRWFTERFREQRPEVVEHYRAMIAGIDDEGYARGCEAVGAFDFRDETARISPPATIVLGVHDPVVSDEGRAALARIPDAQWVELDAAHLACVERPDEFAAAVLTVQES